MISGNRKEERLARRLMQFLSGTLFLVFLSGMAQCQDGQFSQQHATPLLINPALAGGSTDFRAHLNYRSQWKSLGTPFITSAGSFDMRLKTSNRKKANYFGFGAVVITDRSSDNSYRATTLCASAAYHLKVSESSQLAASLSISLEQRNLSNLDTRWGSQFNGFKFDPSLASGESFSGDIASRLDLGSGVVYSYEKASSKRDFKLNNKISAGVAGFHLGSIRLRESAGLSPETSPRYAAFLNGAYALAEKVAIEPAVYGHFQGGSQNIIAGSEVRYLINSGDSFISNLEAISASIGLFTRLNDALIITSSFQWSSYTLGLAYDINASGLKEYSSGRGAFEFFVRWQQDRKPGR